VALDPQVVGEALEVATQRPATLDFFIESLSSPEWIGPMRERGLFDRPPEQRIDDEGLVRAPAWAQSRYLARVAAQDPVAVLALIQSITTDNERVAEDFTDAALAMPIEQASQLATRLARFVEERDHLYYLLPRKLVELIVYLVRGGAVEVAVRLIRALFRPQQVSHDDYWRPRTRPRFSEWEYDMHLGKIVEEAVAHAPELLLTSLVRLLEDALELIRVDRDDPDSDGSRAWRVRIGDDRDRGTDLEESLVSAVRDAAVLVRERGLLDDAAVVDAVTGFAGELHRRIAMFALSNGPDADGHVARRYALSVEELTHYEPSPEYQGLLTKLATSLTQDETRPLLETIYAGPDVDGFRQRAEEYGDRPATDEEVAAYVARWKIGRLALLVGALSPDDRRMYDDLVERFGSADLPLSWEITTFTGPNSPVTADELAAKPDEDLVRYLREWTAPEGRWGGEPSVEGLARAFSVVAEGDAERISRLAPHMQDLKPAYVQWMLLGLEQAVGAGGAIHWPPLLELLEWIVSQPRAREDVRGDDYGDFDVGWVWTRKAIAGLLERGVSASEEGRVPFAERERVWHILELLMVDPEPTPNDESRRVDGGFDPATLALNATRPRAVRAAIAYAVWVYQQIQGTDEATGGGLFTDDAPEVAQALAERVGEREPSAAVRAVFGQFFANLVALDAQWAEENVDRIFPTDDTPQREAAWGAYVIYTRPYNNVFLLLRPAYERAAALAGSRGHGFRWMNGNPVSRLGEHIAGLYWRGVVEIDDSLVRSYWENAPSDARGDVVASVGRWAREGELAPDLVVRLRKLWTFVLDNVRAGNEQAELAGFSWWFVARGLDAEWRLQQMQHLVDSGVRSTAAGVIAEELPELGSLQPLKTLRLLQALIRSEEGWFPDAWRDQIDRVLRIGYRSDEAETRRVAYETVNLLIEKGFREFASVLEQP
jgi:hypothetical protein